MNWIEMMGGWCLAGPAVLLVGCGPDHTEPWEGTQRQLLVHGEPDALDLGPGRLGTDPWRPGPLR